MPDLVVGRPLGDARAHRQHRLRPFRGLDLGFSSTHTATALPGGARYMPTTSRTSASSCGPVENLNPSVRRGCRHNLRHSTVIKSRLTLAFDMQIGMPTAPPLIVSRHPADQAQALNERDR